MTSTETETAQAPDGWADLAALARMVSVLASRVTGKDHPRLALDALAALPGYRDQGAADAERIARLAGIAPLPEQVRLPPRVRPVVLDAGAPRADRAKNATTYIAEPGKNERMREEARQAEREYHTEAAGNLHARNHISEHVADFRQRNGMELLEVRPMYPAHTPLQVSAGTEQR